MVRFYHQCANVLGTHRSQVILIQQNGTKEIGNETKPIEVRVEWSDRYHASCCTW